MAIQVCLCSSPVDGSSIYLFIYFIYVRTNETRPSATRSEIQLTLRPSEGVRTNFYREQYRKGEHGYDFYVVAR